MHPSIIDIMLVVVLGGGLAYEPTTIWDDDESIDRVSLLFCSSGIVDSILNFSFFDNVMVKQEVR